MYCCASAHPRKTTWNKCCYIYLYTLVVVNNHLCQQQVWVQCMTTNHLHDRLVSSLHRGISLLVSSVVVRRVRILIARFFRVESPLLVELAPLCIHNWTLWQRTQTSVGAPLTSHAYFFAHSVFGDSMNCRLHSSSNACIWARRILLILVSFSFWVSNLPSGE